MTKVSLEVTDFYLRAENGLILTICGNKVRVLGDFCDNSFYKYLVCKCLSRTLEKPESHRNEEVNQRTLQKPKYKCVPFTMNYKHGT